MREDPGTAGDEGEETWRQLLADWLPPELAVVTKGRIIGHNGVGSPQVDVIVLRPGYPVSLRSKKVYLAGGVLAAFECKLTLRPGHVNKAAETSRAIRALALPREGTPYEELRSPIAFGVLAHRTAIRRDPEGRVDALLNSALLTDDHPREALDVLTVANLATWRTMAVLMTPQPQAWEATRAMHGLPEEGGIQLNYMRWYPWAGMPAVRPRPLYNLIEHLMSIVALEVPPYRPLAEYWSRAARDESNARSIASRVWPFSILSEPVANAVRRGRLTNGPR